MMYLGSKRRIAKQLAEIINDLRLPGQLYVEPFVGGANMLEHISNPRVGYDINPYLIALLKQIRDDPTKLPKTNTELTEDDYQFLKYEHMNLSEDMRAIIGFAGIPCSYGGQWFSNWRRGGGRDYVNESFKNAVKQSLKLDAAILINKHYLNIRFDEQALIYCDPPYQKSAGYGINFNHTEFFEWCRQRRKEGHILLISEYAAPPDFECIWEQEIKCNFASTRKTASTRIERLFVPPVT